MLPQVDKELKALDPSGTIMMTILLTIAAKIPLGEESLRHVSEGRKAITDLVHNTPRISRNLYYVLDVFLGRMDTIIDGTREVNGTLGDELHQERKEIKEKVERVSIWNTSDKKTVVGN